MKNNQYINIRSGINAPDPKTGDLWAQQTVDGIRLMVSDGSLFSELEIDSYSNAISNLDSDVAYAKSEIDLSNHFNEVDGPEIDLRSVPSISDTYDPQSNEITRNCKEINPFWVAIITSEPDVDFVVAPIEDALQRAVGPGEFAGQTTLLDKNGNYIPELSNQWTGDRVGTHYLNSSNFVWYYIEKGKYANIAEARESLGNMVLTYQLSEPIIEQADVFEYELDLSKSINFKITNDTGMGKEISIINAPVENNRIISVSLLFEAVVATPILFTNNIVWQNDALPIMEEGKSSFVLLSSYDKGQSWFGSIIGTWSI